MIDNLARDEASASTGRSPKAKLRSAR